MENAAHHPEDDADTRDAVDGCGLSPVEELRTAVGAGRSVRRGRGEPAAQGRGWGDDRKVPAELLYELLARPESGRTPRAAVLVGVRITGRLAFEAAELQAPLIAYGCYFEEPVNLIAARAAEIRLTACHIPGVAADGLETRGDLDLSESTFGVVALLSARIGGQLGLNGATLTSGSYPLNLGCGTLRVPEGPTDKFEGVALVADGLQVNQDISCRNGFRAEGEVRLRGAHIGGKLSFDGAMLAKGLAANGLRVDQDMLCRDGFRAEGEVRLRGAHIGGQLSLDGAMFAKALYAQTLQVDQDMSCENFAAEGEIRMRGARIGGLLSFSGARLAKDLSAHSLQVQDMLCRDGFKAEGEIRMSGARIGGQLEFDGATLSQGLAASRLQVGENVFCRNNFTANGEVRLRGARIGGGLEFGLARLAKGLYADGLQVVRDMSCGPLFEAGGPIRLCGAHIGGDLSFGGARLAEGDLALSLKDSRVDGDLVLRFAESPAGTVDLTGARVGTLFDSEETWPMRLRLGGCVYARVEAAEDPREQPTARRADGGARRVAGLRWHLQHRGPPDVRRRLRWIELAEESQPGHAARLRRREQRLRRLGHRTDSSPPSGSGYAPQPYAQLMAFYRQEGRDGDARHVAYARERRRRHLGLLGWAWNVFSQWTVGYGYRPFRALMLLAVLVSVGTLVFSSFHSNGDLKAVQEDHPPFVASIYTIDRLIPVVSFGLRDAFAASGAAQWWAFAYTLLGWALTIAIVAGLTAAVRRD